jgi:uncharacterized protein YdbL (DUF1318 family)
MNDFLIHPTAIVPERVKRLNAKENEEFSEIATKFGLSTEQLGCLAKRLLVSGVPMSTVNVFATEI